MCSPCSVRRGEPTRARVAMVDTPDTMGAAALMPMRCVGEFVSGVRGSTIAREYCDASIVPRCQSRRSSNSEPPTPTVASVFAYTMTPSASVVSIRCAIWL